jgi:hypothetical protein
LKKTSSNYSPDRDLNPEPPDFKPGRLTRIHGARSKPDRLRPLLCIGEWSISRSDWSVDPRGGPTVDTKDWPIALDPAVTLDKKVQIRPRFFVLFVKSRMFFSFCYINWKSKLVLSAAKYILSE